MQQRPWSLSTQPASGRYRECNPSEHHDQPGKIKCINFIHCMCIRSTGDIALQKNVIPNSWLKVTKFLASIGCLMNFGNLT